MIVSMSSQFVEDHKNCPSFLERIERARDEFERGLLKRVLTGVELTEFRKAWLGKEGPVTAMLKKLGQLSATERKEAGEALNNLTRLIKDLAVP